MSETEIQRILDALERTQESQAATQQIVVALQTEIAALRREIDRRPLATEAECKGRHERGNESLAKVDQRTSRIGGEVQQLQRQMTALVGEGEHGIVGDLRNRMGKVEGGIARIILYMATTGGAGLAAGKWLLQ